MFDYKTNPLLTQLSAAQVHERVFIWSFEPQKTPCQHKVVKINNARDENSCRGAEHKSGLWALGLNFDALKKMYSTDSFSY